MTKKWLVLLLVMLFAFHTMVSAADTAKENKIPKKVLKVLKKAEKALKDKKFDKALELYNKAVELGPEVSAVYYGIARLNLAQQKNDEAVQNLDKAIGMDKDNLDLKKFYAQTLYNLGGQAAKQKNAQKSIEYFSKVAELPGMADIDAKMHREALYQIGFAYNTMKNLAKANEYFIKLVNIPDLATADKKLMIQTTYQVGINFYQLKKSKESNEYFIKLLSFPEFETESPTLYISTYYLTGLNATQLNDLENADKYLSKFIELAKNSEAHAQLLPLANFLLGSSKMNALKIEADKIRDDKEKNKKKRIADLALQHKDIETYLNNAIQLNPTLEPAYMHLGNFYYYTDNLDKAVATYETLIEKFPQSQDLANYRVFYESIKVQKESRKKGKKKRKK